MATLILNSGRCSHGKCIFCGYGRLRGRDAEAGTVNECFDTFFSGLEEGEEVKVFGSGSFLDTKQVPTESLKHFVKLLRDKKVGKVTVESRPEHINEESLSLFEGFDLNVAIGLEVADDLVLEKLNKGFTLGDYEKACEKVHSMGFKVRSYVLVNPPYIDDIRKSLKATVNYGLMHSDTMVLINLLPHQNAPLIRLWLDGRWNFLSRRQFSEVVKEYSQDGRIEVDEETFRFMPSIPAGLRDDLKGVGEWYLTHPHFEALHDYMIRWYVPYEDNIALFLPCSYKKPYSSSKTHRGIIGAIREFEARRFHEIMISNAGVIPREFEDIYPFNAYDWDERLETDEIRARYVEVTRKRLLDYLTANKDRYLGVCCFLKYGSDSYKALKAACDEADIELVNLLKEKTYELISGEKSPLQDERALEDLRQGLRWCLQNFTSSAK